MTPTRTRVYALPKSHSSPDLWTQLALRQKEFRLLSLQLSPDAFGSTYEREVQFELEKWKDRLTNPLATTFVALASEARDEDASIDTMQSLLSCEWQACLVMVGPLQGHSYPNHDSNDLGNVAATEKEHPHYELNAMYVLPTVRGKGIGMEIIKAAIAYLVEERRGNSKGIRLTLVVDFDNEPAISLYKKCGFELIQRYSFDCSRRQQKVEAVVMEKNVPFSE